MRIEAMRNYSNAMVKEKFGQKVSIIKLESIMINQDLEAIKQDQHNFAIACAEEMANLDVSY